MCFITGKNHKEDCVEAAMPRMQARVSASDQGYCKIVFNDMHFLNILTCAVVNNHVFGCFL